MAKIVYKYPLLYGSRFEIPEGKVTLVSAQERSDAHPTVWVEHEVGVLPQPMQLEVYGTGHSVLDMREHVGSCVCGDGQLVWHVYKVL